MPSLPAANLSVSESTSPGATGAGYLAVLAPVAQNSNAVPAVYTSTAALLAQFLYNPGVSYCASHFNDANTPILFVPMPIATPGAITYQNNVGVTGTSAVSATVGSNGALEQVAGVMQVLQGTNVGTDQIKINLSLDGGTTYNPVRVGTASTYVIPNVGITLNFGTGTLNVGDVFTFGTTAPLWSGAGITSALAALQAQQLNTRTWLVVGDCATLPLAQNVLNAANTYATANERYTCARVQVSDYSPLPTKSQTQISMQGGSAITFAAAGHTITRATGSWIADGFVNGQMVKVAGATNGANNGVFGPITVTSATVLTLSAGLANEGPDPVGAVTVTAADQIVFTATTITRTVGSWLAEGFAVGQTVAITGAIAGANNTTAAITTLTATVLTASAATFTPESDYSATLGVVQVQTDSAWAAAQTATFATVDASPRINLGYGRARKQDPITGYVFRRPAQWAASIREYQHDIVIPTYRKADGPLVGFTLTDANGNTVEHDEYRSGGALAGRFTCLRSFANGPLGAYVALDLTRDSEGAFLSRMSNEEVANEACRVVQRETENAIGTVLVLQQNGTATTDSLQRLQERVNSALQLDLLQQSCPGAPVANEGPRASSAVWTASTTDNLSNPGATLNGTLALLLNGILEQINTSVQVT